MTHTIPPELCQHFNKWSNLGFTCNRQAAEFILANKDWWVLVKHTNFQEEEIKLVNDWRDRTLSKERSHALANKGTR